MNDLDNNAIDRLLSDKLMGGVLRQCCEDRNDLADVLAKLTPEQWDYAAFRIAQHPDALGSDGMFWRWLLTCDPAIIARAVAEVVR